MEIKCNNCLDVIENVCAFHYFLFKEKDIGKLIFGRYFGVSSMFEGDYLVYVSNDENKEIKVTNGLIIIKTWVEEPSDIELLTIKNNYL